MIRSLATALMLLPVAAPATAKDASSNRAARKYDPDAVRCVRTPITGYLARYEKICMTNREWERNREDARRMQGLVCTDRTRCTGN